MWRNMCNMLKLPKWVLVLSKLNTKICGDEYLKWQAWKQVLQMWKKLLKGAPLQNIFSWENKECTVALLCKVDHWEPSEEQEMKIYWASINIHLMLGPSCPLVFCHNISVWRHNFGIRPTNASWWIQCSKYLWWLDAPNRRRICVHDCGWI